MKTKRKKREAGEVRGKIKKILPQRELQAQMASLINFIMLIRNKSNLTQNLSEKSQILLSYTVETNNP